MPNLAKALARGNFATSSATLYTVPSATTAVLTNIVVTNSAATAATFNILLDGTSLFTLTAIPANSTVVVELKQVLATTKVIAGFASDITVQFHISGMEIS
jgi:hypothetical protein